VQVFAVDMGMKAWFVESGVPKKGVLERETRDASFSDMVNAPPVGRLPAGGGASVSLPPC